MSPKLKLLIYTAKYGLEVHFLCLFIALDLFGPKPQANLLKFCLACNKLRANLGWCTYLCVCNIGPARLHPFFPIPVLNLLVLPVTRFASQICLIQSLPYKIVVQITPSYHLQLCRNMGCCWKHMIRCLFSLLMDCKLHLIPFIVFPWLSVILELGFCLLWLSATLFHPSCIIFCLDLTGFTLTTPILIGRPVFCVYKYLGGTVSWLVIPCDSIAHVELASLDSVCKEVDYGTIAWFTLICLAEYPDAMGACCTLDGGESGYA